MTTIWLMIGFGGGLELLFSNQKVHRISLPARVPLDNSAASSSSVIALPTSGSQSTTPAEGIKTPGAEYKGESKQVDVTYLVHWLKDNLLKERAELFVENETVRPGILVLINDTDWELEGEGDYVLKHGDEIVFISTLHGG